MIRNMFLAILVLGSGALSAQESETRGLTFNHVALSVSDLDRSTDFYESVFGLQEITNRTEIEGLRWFSLGEDKELHLISTVRNPVQINKAVHFALTTSDFDSFLVILQAMNIEYSDWGGIVGQVSVRADGKRQLYLQDPDGYWIEVNSVNTY